MTDLTFMRVKWLTNPVRAEIWYGDPKSTSFTRHELQVGDQFNIKILPGKFCIGSESSKGKWITCMQRQLNDGQDTGSSIQFIQSPEDQLDDSLATSISPDNRSYIQCYRCSATEYFSCRMTCQGNYCDPTSEVARSLCAPPNTSVYLTHVGGELKVGVSLGIPRRWVEQASDLSTVVATAPGLEARRLEHVAAQELGLKLQVRNSTKMRNLSVNKETARKELEKKIKEIKPIAERILGEVSGEIITDPEIIDLSQYYGDLDINTPIQTVDPDVGNEFGGEIVGIKGNILIVNQGVYYYAMDVKKMRSKQFSFLDRSANIETQSFLDQWF